LLAAGREAGEGCGVFKRLLLMKLSCCASKTIAEFERVAPAWGAPDPVFSAVEVPGATAAYAGFPCVLWLSAAGSEAAGPVSLAAIVGIIPGSLTLCPEVGLIASMRLALSSPP